MLVDAKIQQAFHDAQTVGEKYRVAMDAIGEDGDHFYDQNDQKVNSPAEASKALEQGIGDWDLYITDPAKEPKSQTDAQRRKWVERQKLAWIPKATKRVMMLPVGHVCDHCGGSEAVILCIDAEGNVLKGKVIDLG